MKGKLVLNSDEPTKDIKAIAGSRYMRRVGNKLIVWMLVALVVGFGGAYMTPNTVLKLGLCIVVALCAIFLAFMMDKGQKKETAKLLKEYKASMLEK
jgi:hypothetical protein